ncbi:hypothetical protein Q8A64_03535 [Oxalobacteraceae bacterium R-40]|uniref:Uncharacterized protein n=1 Tax=Keguizhuia sedimenti TaxID=3064264 RepID=A0ABU1BKV1_9BURK|nr:hypothetical protein [Oxalobacteraceae bacterium R-40]
MHTPYRSLEQFREKAGLLAAELTLESDEALTTLAHISGYETANDIRFGASASAMLSSREELMARLQAIHPDIGNERAAAVIDKLNLPVRETDMTQLARSPGAAPNISG